MTPKILLVTTCRWFATARLGMSLVQAGCHVEAMCPAGHLLTRARGIQRIHSYSGLLPVRSVRAAIDEAKPDLIIPCDDLATRHLHRLHAIVAGLQPDSNAVLALLERSLGNPAYYSAVDSRNGFMTLAHEEGVSAPASSVITSMDELRRWVDKNGLPAVLKADGTHGGAGTEIVHNREEAENALRKLNVGTPVARAAKRALADRDLTFARAWLQNHKPVVNVQSFISGPDASSSVACWQGDVLALIQFEVLKKNSPNGSATALRLINNPTIVAAVKRMTSRLGLSGLVGFDFILEQHTGHAHLIELNPRATQTCHLQLGIGRDLAAALRSKVSGESPRDVPTVTENDVVALFPQEWRRSPESAHIKSGYHDVPWEEPELVLACMHHKTHFGGWLSRGKWHAVRSKLNMRRA
jgi:hypothetical protein